MLKFIISVSNLDIKILTYFPLFFRMTDEETPDMCSKKRGRPSGTLNKATVIRNNKYWLSRNQFQQNPRREQIL